MFYMELCYYKSYLDIILYIYTLNKNTPLKYITFATAWGMHINQCHVIEKVARSTD
jgi:hypothetical protein